MKKVKRKSALEMFARSRPALFTILVFIAVVIFFTILLALPFSSTANGRPPISLAFFTVNSAISGTGLTAVPTAVYWSTFGKAVIMVTMQIGGLGIMTLASLLGLTVSKHLGLTTRILTASDLKASKYSELGTLIRVVLGTSFSIEIIIAMFLIPRFMAIRESFFEALWHSLFFAVSAFNNAGFDISHDGFAAFSPHWGVAIPMILGITMGAIGFPVVHNLIEVIRNRNIRLLSLHSKITLFTCLILDVIILLWFFGAEWSNASLFSQDTISNPSKHAAGLTLSALTTRASGFSVIDVSHLTPPTLFLSQIWMFIGGGSASTTAGIKVTTLAVLVLAVIAEMKGHNDLVAFKKRLPIGSLKVAITVLLTGIMSIIFFSFALYFMTGKSLSLVMFDVISAYSNCGLTLGFVEHLNNIGLSLFGVIMFIGRLGTMSIAAALMKRDQKLLIRYPNENVILG